MKLIENWQQAWKLKSVQVGALSAFFYALILLSEQFLNVSAVIPQELKNKIPENVAEWVGIFVGVAMVLARLKSNPNYITSISLSQLQRGTLIKILGIWCSEWKI